MQSTTAVDIPQETPGLETQPGLPPLPPGVAAGRPVRLRGRTWQLTGYEPYHDCGALHLSRPDRSCTLLWPFDRPAPEHAAAPVVVPLRHWRRQLESLVTTARDPGTLAARASGARILPYQLAPALAVAAGSHHIVLADEVGLGKTAQAGWIIADCLARSEDARVLVSVPAGLRLQWRSELHSLFGLDARIVNAAWMAEQLGELPADVSPWSPPGLFIVSMDYLKRPDIIRSAADQVWDILIVDEAHTAAAPTGRHAALSRLAARSRTVVLISATPYSGDEASFKSLMQLGDPVAPDLPLIFRRSRQATGEYLLRKHHFARIRDTPASARFHRLLERYTREVWQEALSGDARLAVTVLRKRALSSVVAAARSLRRRERLLTSRSPAPQQLTLFDDETESADEEPLGILAAAGLTDSDRERRWLASLAAAADEAGGADAKLAFLVRLARRLGRESLIVFTEFRDTLAGLAASFPAALQLHGGLTTTERDEVVHRFNRNGGMLLATDAAAEGLNLQARCRLVVNFELPWNPARLEQRIGRVDRLGQTRRVHAISLVARNTAEEIVIANLIRRLTSVTSTLGVHDRLSSFLSEARTAGMVIGGESPATSEGPSVPVIGTVPEAAVQEARRLSRPLVNPTLNPGAVGISSLRPGRGLRRGAVLVFDRTASDPFGIAVSSGPIAIFIEGALAVPRRRREIARLALTLAAHAEPMIHSLLGGPLRERERVVLHLHQSRLDASIAREQLLAPRATANGLTQPGLFESDAVRRPVQRDEDEELRVEISRRIAALSAARQLEFALRLSLVLLVGDRA